ncbi:polysaccharide deacetylase family protein [Desulfocurvus sp. DL9XJH121]
MGWASLLGRSSVVVLCYHNTGGNGMPWDSFAAQMRWLKDAGVNTLSQAGLRRFLAGEPLGAPGVFLTFDDGFRDLYTRVGPFLADLEFNAMVFVINNRVRPDTEPGTGLDVFAHRAHEAFLLRKDRSPWLSWAELRDLSENGILEVGAHSLTHAMGPVTAPELDEFPKHWAYAPLAAKGAPQGLIPRLEPELAGPLWIEEKGRAETEQELYSRIFSNLSQCRKELEWRLHVRVRSLAWPWGEFHPVAMRAARDAGLDMLFTLERGAVTPSSAMDRLPRLEVRKGKDLSWFKSRMVLYSHAATARLYSAMRIG